MTRQQNITLAQVENKIYQAKERFDAHFQAAQDIAAHPEKYCNISYLMEIHVEGMNKAANDRMIWEQVREVL